MSYIQLPTIKKGLRREKIYRMVATVCFLFIVVVAIGVFVHVPGLIVSESKQDLIESEVSFLSHVESQAEDSATLDEVKHTNELLSVLSHTDEAPSFVSLVESALRNRTEGIAITSISLDRRSFAGVGLAPIQLSGIASTRAHLLAFQDALESNTFFKSVDLPVSNLAQTSNVEFSLVLVPQEPDE